LVGKEKENQTQRKEDGEDNREKSIRKDLNGHQQSRSKKKSGGGETSDERGGVLPGCYRMEKNVVTAASALERREGDKNR